MEAGLDKPASHPCFHKKCIYVNQKYMFFYRDTLGWGEITPCQVLEFLTCQAKIIEYRPYAIHIDAVHVTASMEVMILIIRNHD